MRLEGLHHITMITADAQRNIDFYAGTLGLRMVKQTVNFDQPDAYHLYFGDEVGSPGSLLTFFEFAGVAPGRPGAGMIHTLQLGVADESALEFWESRLRDNGHRAARVGARLAGGEEVDALRLHDADGLALELVAAADGNPPLRARHPEIQPEHAILGIEGARAYAREGEHSRELLTETLGFARQGADCYRLAGEHTGRHFHWAYDPPPAAGGRQGAGSVHHIAWASLDEDHLSWRQRVGASGRHVTDVLDRCYFRSIYFREPSGVLFEIATLSPGFAVDEDPEHLGEQLVLPPMHEHLRARLHRTLTPLVNPRAHARA